MRGFLFGSLALIILETMTRKEVAGNAGALLDGTAGLVYRFLSPEVAAVPDFAGRKAAAAAAAAKAKTKTAPSSAGAPALFTPAGLAAPRTATT